MGPHHTGSRDYRELIRKSFTAKDAKDTRGTII